MIGLFEYIFPPKCAFCGTILVAGTQITICETCAEEIRYYNNTINELDLPEQMESYCNGVICVGRYCDILKNSLRRFKFGNKPSFYRAFGKLLAMKLENTINIDEIDGVIAVPLHRLKQKQRGYNQAELIASYAAEQLRKPLIKGVLVKEIDSKSQSSLSRAQRLANLEGAFSVRHPEAVAHKRLLLVDDIVTTGSSINQCCKVLKMAGADSTLAGVVATTRI